MVEAQGVVVKHETKDIREKWRLGDSNNVKKVMEGKKMEGPKNNGSESGEMFTFMVKVGSKEVITRGPRSGMSGKKSRKLAREKEDAIEGV